MAKVVFFDGGGVLFGNVPEAMLSQLAERYKDQPEVYK
jgi:hypothetical protein